MTGNTFETASRSGRLRALLAAFLALAMAVAPVSAAPRVAHVVVALCDNVHQGIVPVPAHLGRGDDPAGNLYWGAAYGVKTWFKRAPGWELKAQIDKPQPDVLERVVFKRRGTDVWLVADAWRGERIERATQAFVRYAAGLDEAVFDAGGTPLPIGGGAALVAYVGHNGLMDFRLAESPKKVGSASRDVVILACASKPYFRDAIARAGANPLLWTTNLMAPEAYTLEAALDAWGKGANAQAVRSAAAKAYARYQKIGEKSASRLLVSGW